MGTATPGDLGALLAGIEEAIKGGASPGDGPTLNTSMDGDTLRKGLARMQVLYDQYRAAYGSAVTDTPTLTGFAPGQLITPLPGNSLRGPGLPCQVLEVRTPPDPDFSAMDPQDTGSNTYGARRDIRILSLMENGTILPYWCESWLFTAYTPPADTDK